MGARNLDDVCLLPTFLSSMESKLALLHAPWLILFWIMCIYSSLPVLVLSGVGGYLPSGASQSPKFVLTPEKIAKISQKYIADPLWFSHKSTTDLYTHRCHVLCLEMFLRYLTSKCLGFVRENRHHDSVCILHTTKDKEGRTNISLTLTFKVSSQS